MRIQKHCSFLLFYLIPFATLAQLQKLYLNPSTASAAPQSRFIEITKFIPVNAAAQKVSANGALFITVKYYVLYDYTAKKLSFLNKEGRFIKSIGIKKYGNVSIEYDNKNELLKFNIQNKNYTLIDKDLVTIRANYDKKSNQKYYKSYVIDLNQEALEIKRTPTDPYFIINAQWYYDNYYYLCDLTVNPKAKDTVGYELQMLQNYKRVQSFFPFNKATNTLFRYTSSILQISLSNTDTPYIKYASRPFNSTIYKLYKDSIQELYKIILPAENAFPESLLRNGFKSKADWENYRRSNGSVFSTISNIANLNSYLLFGIEFIRNYKSFLYEKKSGKFYSADKIKSDSSQFNIHLLQNGLGELSNGKYYKVIPAQGLIDFYIQNKEKSITYPAELELFLKNATKNANPLIVEYKFKD